MARPRKNGLDYFPFDVDFFNDEKIVAIAGEFGVKGEIATIKLLCAIYRNGYFLEWNEMLLMKLLHQLPGLSAELISQIVERLVKWGFFDKDLFNSARILTSRGIQKRYFDVVKKRAARDGDLPYVLSFRGENPYFNVVFAEKTPAKEDFLQRKVHKEKESKEKRDDNSSLKKSGCADCGSDFFEECCRYYLAPERKSYQERMSMHHHVEDLKSAFREFKGILIEENILEEVKTEQDFARLFKYKYLDKLNKNGNNNRLNSSTSRSAKGYTEPDCGLHRGPRE